MLFIISTAIITIVLSGFSENADITAAIIRIITSKSQNWLKKTCSTLFFFASSNKFSPTFSLICKTCSSLNPFSVTFIFFISSLESTFQLSIILAPPFFILNLFFLWCYFYTIFNIV